MLDEELLKEAEEYADCFWGASPSMMRALAKAYIEGAEPREERIKELEAYNEKLLNGDIKKHNKIVALEKEIAKLKAIILGNEKENKEFEKLFIFKKGKCVGKSKISVRPIPHYYGKDWNGYEYYKYSCPICDNSGCNHQVVKGEPTCPICGINLEWEVVE